MHYECRHIMPNGARCQSPALRGKVYCYFHFKLHHLKKPNHGAPKMAPNLPASHPHFHVPKSVISYVTQAIDNPIPLAYLLKVL